MTSNRLNISEDLYIEENSDYLKSNPTWHIEDSPWKAKQVLKIINRNHLEVGSVAEVGCGAGEILNQLHFLMPEAVTFTGYDISSDAINFAEKRRKDRLNFKRANFLEEREKFDLLLIMDVIEHVEDYFGFLRACRSKARNTILHIPLDISAVSVLRNSLMSARKSVGHLHYFTKETAIATLIDSGYKIVDFFYTAGSLELPAKTFREKAAILPRKLLFKANQDFAAKTLGGFSLLVLVENQQ